MRKNRRKFLPSLFYHESIVVRLYSLLLNWIEFIWEFIILKQPTNHQSIRQINESVCIIHIRPLQQLTSSSVFKAWRRGFFSSRYFFCEHIYLPLFCSHKYLHYYFRFIFSKDIFWADLRFCKRYLLGENTRWESFFTMYWKKMCVFFFLSLAAKHFTAERNLNVISHLLKW